MGSIIKSQKKDSLQPKEIYQKKLSLSKLDLEKIKRYTNSSTYLKIKANMPLQKEKSRLPTINKSIPFTLLKRNKNIRSISEDLHTQKKPNNESLSIIQSREKLKEKTRRDSINFPKNKATKQLMKSLDDLKEMTSKFDHCTISIPTKQTYMDEIKDIFPNNIGNNPIFKSMRFSNGLGLLKLKPTFKLNMKSFNEDLNDTMLFSGIPPENKPKSKSLYEKVDNRISKFNNNVKINNPLRGNHSSNSIILRVNNEYLDKYNSSFKQSYNHIIDKIQKNQEKNSILQISPLNKSSILINKKKNIIVRNNKALQIISDN